jgi:hypothetical protein
MASPLSFKNSLTYLSTISWKFIVRISRDSLDSFSFSFSAFFDAAEPLPGPGLEGRAAFPFVDEDESELALREEPDDEGVNVDNPVELDEFGVALPLAEDEYEVTFDDVEPPVDDPSSSRSQVVMEKLKTDNLVIACLRPAAVMALCLMSMVCIMQPSLVKTRSTSEERPTSPILSAFRFKT